MRVSHRLRSDGLYRLRQIGRASEETGLGLWSAPRASSNPGSTECQPG